MTAAEKEILLQWIEKACGDIEKALRFYKQRIQLLQ